MGKSEHPSPVDAGYAMIDAIVALVIISAALVPIVQMQQVLVKASAKTEALAQELAHHDTVMAILSDLNPLQNPEGETRLGTSEFRWQSEEIERFQRNTPLGDPDMLIGLYRVTYALELPSGKTQQGDVFLVGSEPISSAGY